MNPDTHLSYNKITSTATYSYTHAHIFPSTIKRNCPNTNDWLMLDLHNDTSTFKQPVWYLHVSTWFMKNILFEQEKNK